jgi:hypothetical protein
MSEGLQRNASSRAGTVYVIVLTLCCLLMVANGVRSRGEEGQLKVEWNVPITPPGGGLLHWYELKGDPEDGNNLIVCGARRDAQNDAYYGVVYFSHDGGRTWKTAFEDHGSTWVSEQSCAFGKRHAAYFISESSKVIDGQAHHDLGTTRVFMSSNAGESWVETAKTSWADYSNSTFGNPPGSAAGRLYVIYQDFSKLKGAGTRSNGLGFFTVSEDGKTVSAHQTIHGTAKGEYHGVYPTSAVTLSDGTPVALYDAGLDSRPTNGLMRFEIGVVRFDSSGPAPPTVIAAHSARYQMPTCPASLTNSLAYDKARERLYVAYSDAAPGGCALMLTHSQDGGRTWSTPQELSATEGEIHTRYFPLLAIDEAGVLGLLWRGKPEKSPDCWYFSISRNGVKLDETVPLSPCMHEDSLREQSSAYLATVIRQSEARQPASVEILSFRDRLLKVEFSATADGVFHPLWSGLGDGNGELRVARIDASQARRPVLSESSQLPDLAEVTNNIAVLYGGEERLDHRTDSLTVDLSFRNDSLVTISAPLYLKIEDTDSDFGKIELLNPGLPSPAPGLVDLSSFLRRGSLAPHERTGVDRLIFHWIDATDVPTRRFTMVGMKLRFFCPKTRDQSAR